MRSWRSQLGKKTLEVISISSSGVTGDHTSRGVITNNIPMHRSTPTLNLVQVTKISPQVTSSLRSRVTTVASLVTSRAIAQRRPKGVCRRPIQLWSSQGQTGPAVRGGLHIHQTAYHRVIILLITSLKHPQKKSLHLEISIYIRIHKVKFLHPGHLVHRAILALLACIPCHLMTAPGYLILPEEHHGCLMSSRAYYGYPMSSGP